MKIIKIVNNEYNIKELLNLVITVFNDFRGPSWIKLLLNSIFLISSFCVKNGLIGLKLFMSPLADINDI